MTHTSWQDKKSFIIEFWWETWGLLFIAVVITLLIFFVEYSQALLALLDARGGAPQGLSEKLFSETVRRGLSHLDNIPYMDRLSVALFWMIVAGGLYALYSLVETLTDSTKEQIRADRLSQLSQIGLVKAMFVHFGEKIIAVIVFFVGVILTWNVLLQYWLQSINMYVLSGTSIYNISALIIGLVGLCITIYLLLLSAYITWFYERRTLT